jgi:hypothetical protein
VHHTKINLGKRIRVRPNSQGEFFWKSIRKSRRRFSIGCSGRTFEDVHSEVKTEIVYWLLCRFRRSRRRTNQPKILIRREDSSGAVHSEGREGDVLLAAGDSLSYRRVV